MTISRYELRKLAANNASLYSEHFGKRDVKYINQFTTPEFSKDAFDKAKELIFSFHVWSTSDKLYKLAFKHYGDSSLWWVIAIANQKPTESHFKLGDVVIIPQPLNKALDVYGV
jgi:hypothetical protein